MIRPEPATFDELLRDLTVERFGPVRAVRSEHVDSPAEIKARRAVLNEAMAEAPRLATVVPIRRKREAAA